MRRLLVPLTILLLALAGCGGSDDSSSSDKSSSGGGSDRAAVERASRAYIVQQQSDEDDTERPDAITFASVNVNGDSAKANANSSLTGNKYEVTLRKSSGTWQPQTLFTDRPSPQSTSTGDPNEGSGKTASTDKVEKQIEVTLVRALGLKGSVECPPKIKLRRGNNFECKVTGSRRAVVRVTQKDDEGHLNYKVTLRRP